MKDWFVSSLEPTELSAKIDLKEKEVNLLKTMLFPEPESSYNVVIENTPLVSLYQYVSRMYYQHKTITLNCKIQEKVYISFIISMNVY